MDELFYQKDMTIEQMLLFQYEMKKVRKNPTIAFLLNLTLGSFGAHKFYLDKIGWGTLYFVFSWTFLPLIASIPELFFIIKNVNTHNKEYAAAISTRIKNMANNDQKISLSNPGKINIRL